MSAQKGIFAHLHVPTLTRESRGTRWWQSAAGEDLGTCSYSTSSANCGTDTSTRWACIWDFCKQCDQKERYREDGKVHPYCSKTCAKVAIGKKIGQPKQDAKLSNNAMVQEEDTDWMCSNYMAMAGISHVEMSEAAAKLGFVAGREPPVASVYPAVFMTFLQTMGFIPTEDFS